MAATIESAAPTTRRSSARAVAVVSSAHFTSRFYMLLLPPLFPLLTLPVLLGCCSSSEYRVSQHGIQSFSVSALHAIHDAPLAAATTVLSCYLFASPVGVLAGGWVADRIQRRHDLFAATCFVAMAGCIAAVAALPLPLAATGVLFAVTGLFAGMVSPSLDMLIRSMAPPG